MRESDPLLPALSRGATGVSSFDWGSTENIDKSVHSNSASMSPVSVSHPFPHQSGGDFYGWPSPHAFVNLFTSCQFSWPTWSPRSKPLKRARWNSVGHAHICFLLSANTNTLGFWFLLLKTIEGKTEEQLFVIVLMTEEKGHSLLKFTQKSHKRHCQIQSGDASKWCIVH